MSRACTPPAGGSARRIRAGWKGSRPAAASSSPSGLATSTPRSRKPWSRSGKRGGGGPGAASECLPDGALELLELQRLLEQREPEPPAVLVRDPGPRGG